MYGPVEKSNRVAEQLRLICFHVLLNYTRSISNVAITKGEILRSHKLLTSKRLKPNSSRRFEISVNTTDILVSVMACSSPVLSARHLISSFRAMYDLWLVTLGVLKHAATNARTNSSAR